MFVLSVVEYVLMNRLLRGVTGGATRNTVNRGRRTGIDVCIPNVMLKTFFKASRGLNVCHINAGSILPKIDEFREIFQESKAHIIIVSETWCKGYISNKAVEVDGYYLLRNDRCVRRSGGVAVYVKNGLKTNVVQKSLNLSTEYLFFELIFPNSKLLIGAIYKAPRVDEIAVLDEVFAELTASYEDVIIAGDFNENLLVNSNGLCSDCVRGNCTRCRFSEVLSRYSLYSVGSVPTHFPVGFSSSQIDLMITNNLHKTTFYNQISTGLSAHDLLVMTYECDLDSATGKTRLTRRLHSIDKDKLLQDALNKGWNSIYQTSDVDDALSRLNLQILSLLDTHAPLVPVRVSKSASSTKPWMTSDIRVAIIERNIAYSVLKANRTDENVAQYHVLRNRVTQMIRTTKARFFRPWFDGKLGTKKIWNNLKNLGIVSSKRCSVVPAFTASDFNSYLTEPTDDFSRIPAVSPCIPRPLSRSQVVSAFFSFNRVSQADVATSIMRVRSNAIGLDGIPIIFSKVILPVILPHVTYIFNQILTKSYYPRLWKKARVLPVHKKSASFRMKDFRPISILPALSKAFEKVVKAQIVDYIECHKLLNPYQSGFRAGHSTASALLNVSDDILKGFERKYVTILLLHDFSKAFDSVDHDLLCDKLRHQFHFSRFAIALVRSYLVERSQCVDISGHLSSFLPNSVGVPQGSVLGPLLFSLFINDLPDVLRFSRPHLFADDFQNYSQCPVDDLSISDCVAGINRDLVAIASWATRNRLVLNRLKLQAILISNRQNVTHIPDILLSGRRVDFTKSVKNLGLTFDDKLSWKLQCNQIVSKVYAGLRSLYPNCNLVPVNARINLVKSLLMPHFMYGDVVFFDGLSAECKKSLERAFNACVRYAFGLTKRQSVREYKDKILGCDLFQYLRYHTLAFVHSLILKGTPTYLHSKLCRSQSDRTYNYNVRRTTLTQTHNSLFASGIASYNSLPVAVKRAGTVSAFRSLCYDHICRRS